MKYPFTVLSAVIALLAGLVGAVPVVIFALIFTGLCVVFEL